jgi:SAM-dependent methyltransferase
VGHVEYEYFGLKATTWDLLRGDTSHWPDRSLYRDVIVASGQPALDVGCATGRLLLDYLAEGLDVEGVDLSPEMLAICRAKAHSLGLQPTLYQQAMEALDLPRRYRTIVVSSSSFQLLTDPADAVAAMQRIFDHLAPGGTLVMPFMILGPPEAAEEAGSEDWRLVVERVRPEDGALVRRWSRSRYDLVAQLEHTEDRYEVRRDDTLIASELHARSPATRWYTQEQARALYHQAGLVNVHLLSRFSHQPASDEDTLFTILGTRP